MLCVYFFGFDFNMDKTGTISITLFGLLIGVLLGCIFNDSSDKRYFYLNNYQTLKKVFIFGIIYNILNLIISFIIYFVICYLGYFKIGNCMLAVLNGMFSLCLLGNKIVYVNNYTIQEKYFYFISYVTILSIMLIISVKYNEIYYFN